MNLKKRKGSKLYEWQERAKLPESKCRCGETRHLGVDHVVPVNILVQFGLDQRYILCDMEENFEMVCRYCNTQKSGRIDVRNPKTYQVFEKILSEAKTYHIQ